MNIVIFKSSALGDSVVFLPVVQALRRRFPEWSVGLIAYPAVRELFAADVSTPDLLLAEPDDLRTAWQRPWAAAPWLRWVRGRRPDAVLLSYDQSTVAHLLARFAGAPIRLGARLDLSWRRTGLTHTVEWDGQSSIAQWHWNMARRLVAELGGTALPATPPAPDLDHLSAGTSRATKRIVIHPGSKRHMTRWPPQRYAELAGQLAQLGYEVVWIEVPEAAADLPRGVRAERTASLRDLVQLLASAVLFVGNNSGPMHLANATGTPMVIVTGPQPPAWDPAWHRDRVRILRRPELACQPCDRPDWLPRACANTAEPLACLRRWPVEHVFTACLDLLARGR